MPLTWLSLTASAMMFVAIYLSGRGFCRCKGAPKLDYFESESSCGIAERKEEVREREGVQQGADHSGLNRSTEAEVGVKAPHLCRRDAITQQTFYRWKSKYGGLKVSEMRPFEDENRKLKHLAAELTLDHHHAVLKVLALAEQRRRFGYRGLYVLLRREGLPVNR